MEGPEEKEQAPRKRMRRMPGDYPRFIKGCGRLSERAIQATLGGTMVKVERGEERGERKQKRIRRNVSFGVQSGVFGKGNKKKTKRGTNKFLVL